MPCHLDYAIYDWWFNFIWTLCCATWTMPLWLMIQFHLDTMPCHLNYASYEWKNWFHLDTMPCLLNYACLRAMTQSHLDTMPCQLDHANLWLMFQCIWTIEYAKVWMMWHDLPFIRIPWQWMYQCLLSYLFSNKLSWVVVASMDTWLHVWPSLPTPNHYYC